VALNNDFLHVSTVHRTHEFAEHDFGLAAVLFAEDAENDEKNQSENEPERDVL